MQNDKSKTTETISHNSTGSAPATAGNLSASAQEQDSAAGNMVLQMDTAHAAGLSSIDLMQLEAILCDNLSKFFDFSAHSFYFPRLSQASAPKTHAEYLPAESKLLLPLSDREGRILGVFVARGVPAKNEHGSIKNILPLLPAAATLSLEYMRLYKQNQRDALTGLYSRRHLLASLELALEQMREALRPTAKIFEHEGTLGTNQDLSGQNSSAPGLFGISASTAGQTALMLIRLNGMGGMIRKHGYMRTDSLIVALARKLDELKPTQAIAARCGDYELALLLPGMGVNACRELAARLYEGLAATSITNELTGIKVSISPSIGYVNCPRDMDGMERQQPEEQARLLLRRARLAAVVAQDTLSSLLQIQSSLCATSAEVGPPVMAFSGILAEGGRLLDAGPLPHLRVSLGRYAGARSGQRFALWGYAVTGNPINDAQSAPLPQQTLTRRYKGEVALVEVFAGEATAELLHSDDPHFAPQPGDRLTLLGQNLWRSADLTADLPVSYISTANDTAGAGVRSYMDFMRSWCVAAESCDAFSIIIARFGVSEFQNVFSVQLLDECTSATLQEEPVENASDISAVTADRALEQDAPEDDTAVQAHTSAEQGWEDLMLKAAAQCRAALPAKGLLLGRFALNSLIIFVPEVPAGELKERLTALSGNLKQNLRLDSAFGIAPYPFLDFRKADTPENAQKALEYALLLNEPHVGLLDSLALNISADHRLSIGDQLGAITEYKQALLCDDSNILAWNSLGITLAGLARHNEARRHFEEALKRDANDKTTLYNLGNICQTTGEYPAAEEFYKRCLELEPENTYVWYRLGQLEEKRGNFQGAREFYNQTAGLPSGEALTRRSLARISIKEGKLEDAREELHEALLLNPHDALALQLLAGLYLDAGEDPAVAESLARQSVALRPDLKSSWLELARALRAGGKFKDADNATSEAMTL